MKHLVRCTSFLRSIGLSVIEQPGAKGFAGEGVRIECGALFVDSAKACVSTLLHEAGHLAIVPDCYRPLMSGNLREAFQAMCDDWAMMNLGPDDPFSRAMLQIDDPEATAWAWAAGVHLGIPHEEIVRDEDYNHTGADVRLSLRVGLYAGVHGLQHAGFCLARANPWRPNMSVYPKLTMWLQQAQPPSGRAVRWLESQKAEAV